MQAWREVLDLGVLVCGLTLCCRRDGANEPYRSCELNLQELINAPEMVLRAMDSRKNYQPEHFTWFVLST